MKKALYLFSIVILKIKFLINLLTFNLIAVFYFINFKFTVYNNKFIFN